MLLYLTVKIQFYALLDLRALFTLINLIRIDPRTLWQKSIGREFRDYN